MKKLSILFATILVLVSSIIFSACKEGYKNLKIECDVSVVELVLDDSDLSYQDIVFKISGVKSWGEVAIDSKPSGQVQVAYVVDGKNCLVRVQALQPTGDGATLDITHLGSGKMFSVPLKIGMKLRTIESNNKDFIIETPKFDEVDEESEKITIKEIEIPSKQLLICSPSNYTDTIVWKAKEGENVEGVEIVSYNIDGEVIQQVIEVEDESTEKVTGISTAVKSVIKVSEGFDKTKTLKINPISILDGKAVWHTDVTVEVKIMDLLQQDSIVPTSTTHGSEDGVLKDLVLISNPDPNNKREDSSNTGYDYYSTAVIDLSSWVDNPDFKDDVDDEISEGGENLEDEEGLEGDETEIKPEKILQIIDEKFASIYDIEISSDIEGLMLEKVGFTKIRAIASITCVGAGNIKVDFVPKDCVGDIKVFSVDIPCIVGERATGFKASVGLSKEKEDIEIVKENTTFSGVTYLRDAGDSSYGQAFKFEVLSTNTLQALTKYQITINKDLLYVNAEYIMLQQEPLQWTDNYTNYYRYDATDKKYVKVDDATCPEFNVGEFYCITSSYIKDGTTETGYVDLTNIEKYEYQVSIRKDGRHINFTRKGDNFVSEPIDANHTIYMKWVKSSGKHLGDSYFGITLSNVYDGDYDIANHQFDKTYIELRLQFKRQNTISEIQYRPVKVQYRPVKVETPDDALPVKVETPDDELWSKVVPSYEELDKDWQFYFKPEMLNHDKVYYGFYVDALLGLNGSALSGVELVNIDLDIVVDNPNICFWILDDSSAANWKFIKLDGEQKGEYTYYRYDFSTSKIVLIGLNSSNIEYSKYNIKLIQQNNEITSRDITIYKDLKNEDVDINISPNSAQSMILDGSVLEYQYVSSEPADWASNCQSYYELVGGSYVKVQSSSVWNHNKMYYKKVDIGLSDFEQLSEIPKDWETNYQNYYEYVDGNYVKVTDFNWKVESKYYKNNLDASNIYVLSTSSKYNANIEIENRDIIKLLEPSVSASIITVGETEIAQSYANNIISASTRGEIITTSDVGSFKSKYHFIKVTYLISSYNYDYYKLNTDRTSQVEKSIYLYVYEPLTTAQFNNTMLYKYNYDSIINSDLREEHGKHILEINLNNNSSTILNYVDIKWNFVGASGTIVYNQDSTSTTQEITFKNTSQQSITGRIVATFTQFGKQLFPIYCDYIISAPVLSEQVVLDTPVNTFKSGAGYVNLKVGESKNILATAKLLNGGEVSFPGVTYQLCGMEGYSVGNIASVTSEGKLTANNAGKAKLIIMATDRIKKSLSEVTNYLQISEYLSNDAYVIIDVIVSDGSEHNPFLISSRQEFIDIQNDYYYISNGKKINTPGDTSKINDYHYALVSDIDLIGQPISFKKFQGKISSFQENINSKNRFTIHGIILDESNPNLFVYLPEDTISLKNIDFRVNINYKSSKVHTGDVLIGLIGTNSSIVENITITIDARIDAGGYENDYYIGSISAKNDGTIKLTDEEVIGVQGSVVVSNSSNSNVVLGGVVGQNTGNIIGAGISSNQQADDGEVKYDVYYDNQGATADISLQVKSVKIADNSAIGGIVGVNQGLISKVYTTGVIKGKDDAGNLTIDNVGGLIGKNLNVLDSYFVNSVTERDGISVRALGQINYNDQSSFQIEDSYSSMQVSGHNNVGGVVGHDDRGTYKHVYYEIYTPQTAVQGSYNVGGLIGYSEDTDLYYCYANSFALNNKTEVTVYDIVGDNNVGGLIGLSESTRLSFTDTNKGTNIVKSFAGVSLTGGNNVSGLVGRMTSYGAIYIAYFYGVIDTSINQDKTDPIVMMYNDLGDFIQNYPYNKVYAFVNGSPVNISIKDELYGNTINFLDDNDACFTYGDYNNGYGYIDYNGSNLASLIPTKIEINKAFEDCGINPITMFKPNDINGEYIFNKTSNTYEPYTDADKGNPRYSLMANVVSTGVNDDNNSDYRRHALVLYYYPFSDMSGENALDDYNRLNIVNMHDIVADDGIIIVPATLKRFTLRSSDSSIITVLNEGRIMLNREGQVTITLVSTLNPSVSASFVVFVRSKVLQFNLYDNANINNVNNNIKNKTISIVKGTSKIIYPSYTSTITVFDRPYNYRPATNMQVEFGIKYYNQDGVEDNTITINEYIKFNETYNVSTGKYSIPYGTPITISVDKYIDGYFEITASPYVVVTYNGNNKPIPLSSYFDTTFKVVTKKGVSAINADKTQFDMMPADDAVDVDVKITTDVEQERLYFVLESAGANYEINNPNPDDTSNPTIKFIEMLNIIYGTDKLGYGTSTNSFTKIKYDDTKKAYYLDISGEDWDDDKNLQDLSISLELNEKSYYIDEEFTLQLTFYVLNSYDEIAKESTIEINVKPQKITSIINRNYRAETANDTQLRLDQSYQSEIIRPGSTNIITIDIAPSIAVYDYVEIVDITAQDKIILQQVQPSGNNLVLPDNMDTWIDSGIKLVKTSYDTSKLYIFARLPKYATANITHTLKITAYKDSEEFTSYLNLEAIMYPTVVMHYIDPNGNQVVEVNTNEGINQIKADETYLAMGVQADIIVETNNIDANTLKYQLTVTDSLDNDETDNYKNLLVFEYRYGQYVLQFNPSFKNSWENLLNKKVNITFTASKSLNGITETCQATISFIIRRMVIHSVSMTHTTTNNEIYGYWSNENNSEFFSPEFFFDKTDISYYYNGYWNTEYYIGNTDVSNSSLPSQVKDDLGIIHNILTNLNEINTTDNDGLIYLLDKNINANLETLGSYTAITSVYNQNGITIENGENGKLVFKAFKPEKDGAENINDKQFVVHFAVKYDNYVNGYPELTKDANSYNIIKSFGFNVSEKTTPFDKYEDIKTAEDFNNMIEGRFYKLVDNITLSNYVPLNVAIGGLDGNGKTITIKDSADKDGGKVNAFNMEQLVLNYASNDVRLGLFDTLQTNVIVSNLKIKYEGVKINLDNYIQQQETYNNIYFGGIAGNNLGVITNVNIEGVFNIISTEIPASHLALGGITAINGASDAEKVATITNSTSNITLDAIVSIGGVAKTNYGKITNSKFTGKIVSSNNEINQYVADVQTAGFVVENLNKAYISLSSVDCEYLLNDYNIKSVGNSAGFVLNNSGTINNAYVNKVKMHSQGNIGGFVYESKGTLSNCYANATFDKNRFYSPFIHIEDDVGQFTNCYVVTDDNRIIYIDNLVKIDPDDVTMQDMYQGFIFEENNRAIWAMNQFGPYLPNCGYDVNKNTTNTYNIYDLVTFDGYGKIINDIIDEDIIIRLVRDIDFKAEGYNSNPVTFNKILSTSFEGNDMVLSNYNIFNSDKNASIGLFAEIKAKNSNTFIRNLTLQPASIKASSTSAVGGLAGVIDGVKVYNIIINAPEILMLGQNAVGGLAGILKGPFEVVGVTSNISAFATYNYSTSQYNLYNGKNVLNNDGIDNIVDVSYAGSVAGIVNGYEYGPGQIIMNNRDVTAYYTIRDITLTLDIKNIGEVVGGAFGLVGERTLVDNLNYNLSSSALYQGIYVSGGLVGENRGVIQNSSIVAYDLNGKRYSTIGCFDKNARVNGAIVGVNIGGLIYNCISDIDVYSNINLSTVGGIVGRNIEGSIYNCQMLGYIKGYYAGGIAGTDYSYDMIINQKNGFGVATYTSVNVYNNIKDGVKYTNISDENVLYKKNVLSNSFIKSFISNMDSYYTTDYNYFTDTNSIHMVNATSVFGLSIGMTNKTYRADMPDDADPANADGADIYYYNESGVEQLSITLTQQNPTENNPIEDKYKYKEIEINGKNTNVIDNIKISNNSGMLSDWNSSKKTVKYIYIIAYSNSGYEFWSPTVGYGNDCILFTK